MGTGKTQLAPCQVTEGVEMQSNWSLGKSDQCAEVLPSGKT